MAKAVNRNFRHALAIDLGRRGDPGSRGNCWLPKATMNEFIANLNLKMRSQFITMAFVGYSMRRDNLSKPSCACNTDKTRK